MLAATTVVLYHTCCFLRDPTPTRLLRGCYAERKHTSNTKHLRVFFNSLINTVLFVDYQSVRSVLNSSSRGTRHSRQDTTETSTNNSKDNKKSGLCGSLGICRGIYRFVHIFLGGCSTFGVHCSSLEYRSRNLPILQFLCYLAGSYNTIIWSC